MQKSHLRSWVQESCIKCRIPGGIKFSSQVGKVGSHCLRWDPAILTWDPGWDCRDPTHIPPDNLPGANTKKYHIFILTFILTLLTYYFLVPLKLSNGRKVAQLPKNLNLILLRNLELLGYPALVRQGSLKVRKKGKLHFRWLIIQ